jgi:hypothetical protein
MAIAGNALLTGIAGGRTGGLRGGAAAVEPLSKPTNCLERADQLSSKSPPCSENLYFIWPASFLEFRPGPLLAMPRLLGLDHPDLQLDPDKSPCWLDRVVILFLPVEGWFASLSS